MTPGASTGAAQGGGHAGHGTTVTGHRPARTSRTPSDPTIRCPAEVDAPTITASASTSPQIREISV